jgi:DNA-binding MarR family transcriptional regulator
VSISTPVNSNPALDLFALTYRLASRLSRLFEQSMLTGHGISLGEWRTMLMVMLVPDTTAADVAGYFAMDKMAVTRAVQRLTGEGYLTRQRRDTDKRSYALRLTAEGQALFARLLPLIETQFVEIVGVLSQEERDGLHGVLLKLFAKVDTLHTAE